jgi:hypothetical protein
VAEAATTPDASDSDGKPQANAAEAAVSNETVAAPANSPANSPAAPEA